ncbi:MAG: response regulator [Methylococcaceae bacterium]|nr:MAG: response regulator [Methylococcaceae bacterium]
MISVDNSRRVPAETLRSLDSRRVPAETPRLLDSRRVPAETLRPLDSRHATILVVDDSPENIEVLGSVLSAQYDVRVAIDGDDALRQAFGEPPDLILLDIMMPGIDGYEVCRRLKRNPSTCSIPVIFVTALGQVENETQGFRVGGADYITKPISPPVVLARVATHLALSEARRSLERKNALLTAERELVEEVLRRTRELDQFDPRGLRYLISPLEKTNGDVLLAAFAPDGCQHVLLGDFTGHGLSAAIGSPVLANLFYSGIQEGTAAAVLLQRINQVLYRVLPVNLFLAAAYVEIAPDRRSMRVWNCGVPDLLLIRQGGVFSRYPSASFACGVSGQLVCDGAIATLEPGDRLYAYSDGIIETLSASGESYGAARLEVLLAQHALSDTLIDQLRAALTAFAAGGSRQDDATLVEIAL